MLRRTVFLCIFALILVKFVEMDATNIKFKIDTNTLANHVSCDHTLGRIQANKYTALEGGHITFTIAYRNFINSFSCTDFHDEKKILLPNPSANRAKATVTVTKEMGNLWKCTILTNKYTLNIRPIVIVGNHSYTEVNCYMQVHVRRLKSSQSILVNNMVVEPVRTDLSVKDVDFTVQYEYADSDLVNVTCMTFDLVEEQLYMEYSYADRLSNKFRSTDISSALGVGFRAKLNSAHNNTHMICRHKGNTDETTVMITLIMRSEFNTAVTKPPVPHTANTTLSRGALATLLTIRNTTQHGAMLFVSDFLQDGGPLSLKINGMMLRLAKFKNNRYSVEYRHLKEQKVFVVCRAERPDIKLSVDDKKISDHINSYHKEFNGTQSVEATFSGTSRETMMCLADNKRTNHVVDVIEIEFIPEEGLSGCVNIECQSWTKVDLLQEGSQYLRTRYHYKKINEIDRFPLHMDLPQHGTIMELYESNNRRVIYYEFEEGEELTLNCYTLSKDPLYVKFNDSDNQNDINITKTLKLYGQNEGTVVTCCLMEKKPPIDRGTDTKMREIVVIFRQKVITTTTSTTLVPTSMMPETLAVSPAPTRIVAEDKDGAELLIIGIGVAIIIVILVVATIIYKLRKRNHAQGGPYERNYENLQNQSEGSIPAHPVQWDSNYAVPVDLRPENETYSEPVKPEADMYATPIPKSKRKKNEKSESNYASLNLNQSASGRKNVMKDTDDPNYAEISNKLEDCYSKVLPKSKRNVHNENTYANVAKESPYANTVDEPEPMYCDPNTAPKSQKDRYVNVNNAHYANRPAQEYVEPTYCEPAKFK